MVVQEKEGMLGRYSGRGRTAKALKRYTMITGKIFVPPLHGISRRKGSRTTVRRPETCPPPDLVKREFSALAPNRLWVVDMHLCPQRGSVSVLDGGP
jgi:hypothetical protein